VRSQELVSGERLQPEVSGPFCRQPLLGCIDGSSMRRGQERVCRQIVTDDLQVALQKTAETALGCMNGTLFYGDKELTSRLLCHSIS
jgi:hypothetical protein